MNHRYRQIEPIGSYRHVPTYAAVVSTYETRTLTAMDVIRLCHCVEYQSCEPPEWETSWARGFLQRVVETTIHDLPGYDDAPWGLCASTRDRDVDQVADAQLATASLPRLYATLADATLPDDIRRMAVAALLRGCTVSDVLMHLRDACRQQAARFAPDDLAYLHFERAAAAIQQLRETVDI